MTFSIRLLLVLLGGCLACAPAQANEQKPVTSPPPGVPGSTGEPALATPSTSTSTYFDDLFGRYVPRVGYNYDAFDTVGRDNGGLSTIQAFVPLWEDGASAKLLFSDSRLLVFDDRGTIGANVGLGGRMFSGSLGRTLGGYLYWDYSDTGRTSFNQVSGGFESLGDRVDARANFYVPVGKDRKQVDQIYFPSTEATFQNNYLLVGGGQGLRLLEQALVGFDGEAGLKFFSTDTLELRAFAGMYHYQGDAAALQAWGPRGRLEARLRDTMAMGVSVQNDRLFGTTVNLNVLMTFPRISGRALGDGPAAPLLASDRLGDPVVRLPHIAVERRVERFVVAGKPVVDPLTGQPYLFLHVAPGGSSDGSFENPYGNLAAAFADPRFARGNVVVFDRTQGTYNGNITLAPGTKLISSGPLQVLDTANFGQVLVPLSGTSTDLAKLPTIQGTITLTGPGAVSGFEIRGAGRGIVGVGPVRDVAIANNIVRTAGTGISIPYLAGPIDIRNNRLLGTGGGIHLGTRGTDQVLVRINNNIIQAPRGDGIILQAGGASQVDLTLTNNKIDGAMNNGILLTSGQTGASDLRVTATENKISNSGANGDGAFTLLASGATGSATLLASMGRNDLRNNHAPGVTARSSGANQLSIDLFANNALSQNSFIGFLLQQQGGSTFEAVDPNTIGTRNTGTVTTSGTIGSVASIPW